MLTRLDASTRDTGQFTVRPLTERCHRNLATYAHACLGISPFNGYFTEDRITDLAAWALTTFSSIHLYVPDGPAAYTLEALGYPPGKAAWKARRQGQYLRNKIHRALARLDVECPDRLVLDSAALATNPHYERLHRQVRRVFTTSREFAAECLEATRWVLDNRLPDGVIATRRQRRSAVRYLLAELPLFADAGAIAGRSHSVFCYHQSIPLLHRFYERRLPWRPAERQGFAVITPISPPAAGTA